MEEANQALPPEPASPEPPISSPVPPLEPHAPATFPSPLLATLRRARDGLVKWMLLVLVLGLLSLGVGQPSLGVLLSLGLLYAVAHAADVVPQLRGVGRMVEWTVWILAAFTFIMLAAILVGGAPSVPNRGALQLYLLCSAVLVLGTLYPRIGDTLTRRLLHSERQSFVLGLTARLVVATALVCVPAAVLFHHLPELLDVDPSGIIDSGELVGSLLGYNLLALAGVGWMVRRDFRAALERLGVGPIRGGQWAWVIGGTAALIGLSVAGESFQRSFFPDLYASDRRFDELVGRTFNTGGAFLLALTAGTGEELTLRGALQPRLGLGLTALLFAGLHVQYSWVGMAFIFLFGLALGFLRQRTNTTVSVLVHALYDVAVVLMLHAERSRAV